MLYTDHKFLKSATWANPSVDNHHCGTSEKCVECVSKTCLQEQFRLLIRLETVLKTSLLDVFKTFWRRHEDVLARRLEEVLKTSWRCFEDVWQKYWSWPRRLDDVLKTYSEEEEERRMFGGYNLSTLDFKLAKSTFSANGDVSAPAAVFKSAFVAELDKSNTTFPLPPKDFCFGLYSLIYTMLFLSIKLLDELLDSFHLTYNLSYFLFIAFSILNSF